MGLGRAEARRPEVKRESAHKCIELLAGRRKGATARAMSFNKFPPKTTIRSR